MNRINLTDGSGRWFDKNNDKVEAFYGDYDNNRDTRGEDMYRTAGGVYVLNRWTRWQGERGTWEAVDNETAAYWLLNNKHFDAAEAAQKGILAATEI